MDRDAKRPRLLLRRANDQSPPRSSGVTLQKASAARERSPERPMLLIPKGSTARERSPEPRSQPTKAAVKSEEDKETIVHTSTTVRFDVCGQIFKVPTQLIQSRPETLLAELYESHRITRDKAPIFVDCDVARFPLILDWYRYDEIYAPPTISIDALLMDAAHMQLPEELCVNGIMRSTLKSAAKEVSNDLIAEVIQKWRGFAKYLERTLEKIRVHYKTIGEKSATGSPEDEAYDFLPYRQEIFSEDGKWVDKANVSSAARARVLALKLEERGYLCSFSDIELIVTLPLKLNGETNQLMEPPLGEDEEEKEAAA